MEMVQMLESKEIILVTQIEEPYTSGKGRVDNRVTFHVNKRDSHVVMAQVSPEFAAALVDRWEELEAGKAMGIDSLPDSFICGDSSLILEYGLSAIAGLPDFDNKNKTYKLHDDFILKKFTISSRNGGSTYMKVPYWVLNYAKRGLRRFILVTNADNPFKEEWYIPQA